MRTLSGDLATLDALAKRVSRETGYPRMATRVGEGHTSSNVVVTERACEPTQVTPPGWTPGAPVPQVFALTVLEVDVARATTTRATLEAVAKTDDDAPPPPEVPRVLPP